MNDQTGKELEPFIFRLDPSPAGKYEVDNFASLKAAGPGQSVFNVSANTNLTLYNVKTLSADLNAGSVIKAYGGTLIINNYGDIQSASSSFAIDILGASSGRIYNTGAINGKNLIRSNAPFTGTIINNGSLNAGAGTAIDFSSSSALNLENKGVIRGNIYGSPSLTDNFKLDSGVFNGVVNGVEQVTSSGQSNVSGTFTGTLQFRNSGELSTDGLVLDGTDYIQETNSSLVVSLTEANLTQPVIESGSASFSSGSTLSLEPDFYVLTREGISNYKALRSNTTIAGKDQLNIDSSLFFDSISITGNHQEIDITLQARDIDEVIAESGLIDDSKEAYSEALENVIDVLETPEISLATTSEVESWFSALTAVSDDEQLAKIAKELKPSTNGSIASLPMTMTRSIQQQLTQKAASRFDSLNYGDTSESASKRLWGVTYHSTSHYKKQRKKNGTLIRGYDVTSDGLTLGYDQQWSNDLMAGVAFSYGNSKTKKNHSPDFLNLQSYLISLYGQKRWSDWSLTAVLSSGLHKNTHQRFYEVASLDSAKSKFDSRHHGLSLLLAKKLQYSDWFISPHISLNYQTLSTPNYTETGSLNYHYASNEYKLMESGVGILTETFQKIGRHLLTWQFSGSVWHDFKAKAYEVKTAYAFTSKPSWFTSTGTSLNKNRYEIQAGLSYSMSEQAVIELAFSRNGSERWHSDSGYLRLEYNF
ncbi:autotransporter outer membrane beta-barrel domain-containing protein [Endozoicomonas montiporae]|uniref:autotransporter outer membrane beta-barrel domain-containing protein n=1 Tax=Endozoicomonas montiporae TaxID=1027273 RepID=UPI001C9DF102|nr:autotransporter outer membrane beta-barrel domain-containing protein [Endozoicomonas montiporae]